jgi:hypothetical protein
MSSEQTERAGAKVMLAVPFYQQFPGECIGSTVNCCVPPDDAVIYQHGEAFVERNFSHCWAEALNSRDREAWTEFGMIHVDVQPSVPGWLSLLVAERRRVGADLLSVVLPIKTSHGLTSTAVLSPDGRWRRLTLREAWRIPDVTFDAEAAGFPGCRLLASTGLWVADFTRPWVEEVWFETRCRIVRDARSGKFEVQSFPEDWHFSRMLHDRGLKVMATKLLSCAHWGMAPYPNNRPWGTVAQDEWHGACPWLEGPAAPAVSLSQQPR